MITFVYGKKNMLLVTLEPEGSMTGFTLDFYALGQQKTVTNVTDNLAAFEYSASETGDVIRGLIYGSLLVKGSDGKLLKKLLVPYEVVKKEWIQGDENVIRLTVIVPSGADYTDGPGGGGNWDFSGLDDPKPSVLSIHSWAAKLDGILKGENN